MEGKTYPTSNLVLPSIYGCIDLLREHQATKQPWDNRLLLPSQLRPEILAARRDLYDGLVARLKTAMPESRKRCYVLATMCDPRQKNLRFPGVDAGMRALARVWFQAEYTSLWGPAPVVTQAAPAPAPRHAPPPSHPQQSGASFVAFMVNLSHVQDPVQSEESSEDEAESEAARYLDLPDLPMETDILEWWAICGRVKKGSSRT